MLPGTALTDRDARLPSSALREVTARFGTPAYVIDMAAVAAAASRLETTFGQPWLRLYSMKANDLPEIISFLHGQGWDAGVVSTGEWEYARAGLVANASVAFEGIGKTDAQLQLAVHEAAAGQPLRWLAVESADEVSVLARLAGAAGLGQEGRPPLDILLRLNPAVTPETRAEFAVGRRASKFGMSHQEILGLARSSALAGPGLRLRGIHVHVGSDLGDVRSFRDAGTRAARLLAAMRAAHPGEGSLLDTIDFGGGFPLLSDAAPAPEDFRDALVTALHEAALGLPPRPAVEPGRLLVGAAGWLVASVLHVRSDQEGAQQVVLDAGMTEFIRPALYGSRHSVHVLRAQGLPRPGHDAGAGLLDTSLEGPVCESTDSFGRYLLPGLRRGDLVAIGQAGAYGASFTSRYNGRPQPAEVLLWPDGSLQPCERPALSGAGWPPAARAPHSTAAPLRQEARQTVVSAATKESLP
jgi:diaminopimelate decarboxylase